MHYWSSTCKVCAVGSSEVNHGADAFLEVLCQCIQGVKDICLRRGQPFPKHLVVQSDNTVAQAVASTQLSECMSSFFFVK